MRNKARAIYRILRGRTVLYRVTFRGAPCLDLMPGGLMAECVVHGIHPDE